MKIFHVISTPAGAMADVIKNEINGNLLKDWTVEDYTLKLIDFINCPEDQKNTIGKTANLFLPRISRSMKSMRNN